MADSKSPTPHQAAAQAVASQVTKNVQNTTIPSPATVQNSQGNVSGGNNFSLPDAMKQGGKK